MKYPASYEVTVYKADDKRNARYALGNSGEKTLLCFGINPSTANRNEADQTMKWLIDFSRENGYDSCIMMNPYPLRTSCPDTLPANSDEAILCQNFIEIEKIFKQKEGQPSIAMWGNIVETSSYMHNSVLKIIELSKKYGIRWFQLGNLSGKGNPRHIFLFAT